MRSTSATIAAAAAAAPIAIVLSALILAQPERPLTSVWVFTAGAALLDLAMIVIVLAVFGASDIGSGGEASAILDTALGALFLLLGVMALLSKESPRRTRRKGSGRSARFVAAAADAPDGNPRPGDQHRRDGRVRSRPQGNRRRRRLDR